LLGVFEKACQGLRLPYFSCRGYASDSEIWGAARRLKYEQKADKEVVILHFGDHDPSGLDMTRDCEERLKLFGADVTVERLALNWAQIKKYNPPPNPAKETDSRFEAYQVEFGDDSYELDALEPRLLAKLVSDQCAKYIRQSAWKASLAREKEGQEILTKISDNYEDVIEFLNSRDEE
jgi:hypothetical protein